MARPADEISWQDLFISVEDYWFAIWKKIPQEIKLPKKKKYKNQKNRRLESHCDQAELAVNQVNVVIKL